MKTQVKEYKESALAREYEWRSARGEFLKIENMGTNHLFHVVRMIWDHSMPENLQTKWPRRYTFPSFYTQEYMALSIRLMLPALLVRKDLTTEHVYWLNYMKNSLLSNEEQISFIKKIGYKDVLAT